MNFYRHKLDYDNTTITAPLDFQTIMPDNLNNWGFTLIDGSPIQTVKSSQNIRWQYDSVLNDPTSRHCIKIDSTNYMICLNANIPLSTATRIYFFIPLKNKGFLLRCEGAKDDTMYNTNTPPFHAHDYNLLNPIEGITEYPMTTTIGLFNSSFINPMIYLQFGEKVSRVDLNPNTHTKSYTTKHEDLIINNTIFPLKNIRLTESTYVYRDTSVDPTNVYHRYPLRKTNIVQNVCTLIRAPYNNQYLDGLYIATTLPCDSIDGKVFSFNGRNFLGVHYNLAVELPAN